MSDQQQAPPPAPMHEGEEAPPRGVRTMAVVRWLLVLAMASIAIAAWASYAGVLDRSSKVAGAAEYYCPMHPSVVSDRPGTCPICSMDLVERAPEPAPTKDFYCPMHPTVSSDHAGTCPICSMDLVPRERGPASPMGQGEAGMKGVAPAAGVDGLSTVELSAERIQLGGLRTAVAKKEEIVSQLRLVGSVAADERRLFRVHARTGGWVEQLLVNETGQKVAKGQVLAKISSAELLAAQRELLALSPKAGPAPVTDSVTPAPVDALTADLRQDARHRLELLGVGAGDIAEIERTGKPIRAVSLRAPSSGIISSKSAFEGLNFEPGAELFQIADLSAVWVLADVYESELRRVRVGQPAKLQLAAFPGKSRSGTVAFLSPAIDPATRALRVRLEFLNPGLLLRPGMYGEVLLATEATQGVVVPREAVIDTGELRYVFVAHDGGRFEPRRVQLGIADGDRVEIVEGLREGERVVTTANFLLDSESRLRASVDSAPPPGAGAAGASSCDAEFDKATQADKYRQCRACETQHRGMGTMEADCRNAIPKPWR